MNALCKAYSNADDADRAVEALLAAGVPRDDVRLLMGADVHDARREAAGGFAGAVAAEDRVGAFAGEGGDRSAAMGSFAGDSATGGEGVFANADRDVVVTYSDGEEQARVAGHRQLTKLLVDAGLDEPTAETDVRALHDGRVLVLVTLGAVAEDRAREVLGAVG
ncbi:MAG: hypothetical protein V7607_2902 [Solirubrobacteraceae bacterium]